MGHQKMGHTKIGSHLPQPPTKAEEAARPATAGNTQLMRRCTQADKVPYEPWGGHQNGHLDASKCSQGYRPQDAKGQLG